MVNEGSLPKILMVQEQHHQIGEAQGDGAGQNTALVGFTALGVPSVKPKPEAPKAHEQRQEVVANQQVNEPVKEVKPPDNLVQPGHQILLLATRTGLHLKAAICRAWLTTRTIILSPRATFPALVLERLVGSSFVDSIMGVSRTIWAMGIAGVR